MYLYISTNTDIEGLQAPKDIGNIPSMIKPIYLTLESANKIFPENLQIQLSSLSQVCTLNRHKHAYFRNIWLSLIPGSLPWP